MKAIVIHKAANGYVAYIEQESAHVTSDMLNVFPELGNSYGGSDLLDFLRNHFEPKGAE